MFINNFDPVAINFFSLEIRWYSLAYIFGILAGWVLAKRFFINNQGIKIKFDDYVTYIIFGIIIGGRLGYVLFYNLDYYFEKWKAAKDFCADRKWEFQVMTEKELGI